MRNIKLTVEYDGTNYNGWQIQKSKVKSKKSKLRTIQEEIEKAIEKITGRRSNLYGSGRTDSGVHAKGQTANFRTLSKLSLDNVKRGLNAVLPEDISITRAEEVNKDFHSRFNAKSKAYRYTILNRSSGSPFLKRYALYTPYCLNLPLMRKEAMVLAGRHDFRSFAASSKKIAFGNNFNAICAVPPALFSKKTRGDNFEIPCNKKEKSTIRTIKRISINKEKNSIITIDIEADGFLYNMVRNIIGTLIEIGRGKLPPGSMRKILSAKDRTEAGPTAPQHGLCLMKVKY